MMRSLIVWRWINRGDAMSARLSVATLILVGFIGMVPIRTSAQSQDGATPTDVSPASVISDLEMRLGQIRSVQCTSSNAVDLYPSQPPPPGGLPPEPPKLRLFEQGHLFRAECISSEGWNGRPARTMIFAYNGDQYQILDDLVNELRVSDAPRAKNVYLLKHPLMPLFYWAFEKNDSRCWAVLTDPACWDRVLSKVAETDTVTHGGEVCTRLRVNRTDGPLPDMYYEVLIPEGGYYPVAWRSFSKTGTETCNVEVLEEKLVETAEGPVKFPIKIRIDSSGADGVSTAMTQMTTVEPQSVRINEPIDEELFTLSSTPTAAAVIDLDKRDAKLAKRRQDRELARTPLTAREDGRGWRLMLIIGNVLLIGVIALVWWWRGAHPDTRG